VNKPLVKISKLVVVQNGIRILHDINAEIYPGEIISLIGLNGSGKTTLLKTILGLIKPTSGTLSVNARKIGYVPQKLDFDRTIPITIFELLKIYNPKAQSNTINAKLEEVSALKLGEKLVGTLSGGQLQRVLIANALINLPDLLLLDEATAGIDITGEDQFYSLIKQIHKDYQPTILLVSHDIHTVFANTDRVFCMDGCLCCQGTPEAIAKTPEFKRLFGKHLKPYHHKDHAHHSHRGA